jgi:hypothetical protein
MGKGPHKSKGKETSGYLYLLPALITLVRGQLLDMFLNSETSWVRILRHNMFLHRSIRRELGLFRVSDDATC